MRHQACGTLATVAWSAAPSSARTKTSRPAARQLSITRRGNPPLPAMIPNGPWGGPWAESSASAAIRPFRLADRAARIGADKGDDVVDRADPGKALGRVVDPVVECPVIREQELIRAAQPLDVVAAEAAALHADDVDAGQPGAVAHHQAVGDDVALDPGHAADHRMPADPHELVHRRQPAEYRMILDHDMTAERRVVDEDDVIADLAVMRDMGADHQQAMIADSRDHATAGGAGVDRHMLADRVVMADFQRRRLAGVFQVLRLEADRGEGEDPGPLADRGPPVDHDMRFEADAGAEHDMLADHAIGADHASGATIAVGWIWGIPGLSRSGSSQQTPLLPSTGREPRRGPRISTHCR